MSAQGLVHDGSITPSSVGVAIEEIKALAAMAWTSNETPDNLIPVFGAIQRLAENAQQLAGILELTYAPKVEGGAQ